jgi:hypothetical protein
MTWWHCRHTHRDDVESDPADTYRVVALSAAQRHQRETTIGFEVMSDHPTFRWSPNSVRRKRRDGGEIAW